MWAILVALGIAKPIMDWVLSLHMISLAYTVGPFDVISALMLVVFTAIVGYALGYLIGMFFPHCRDCSDGSCCFEGETAMDHNMHMMGDMMMEMPKKKTAKRKATKKAAPKAKAKAKKKRK